ncbi:hypothetical protein PR048_007880 [Dryococelus australis]|uniref:Uncharacterized protein n=1 Tax=Dryococelus australis TaxID=614101 RepID=A0ABQ9HVI2_9NEOP|nr:hypothetical protein PR048_007880 [Dryococelus australis]
MPRTFLLCYYTPGINPEGCLTLESHNHKLPRPPLWDSRNILLASHQGEPGSIAGRVTPNFRKWESCWTIPLVGGFTRDLPFSPNLHSGSSPFSPYSTLSSALRTSLLRTAQISKLNSIALQHPELQKSWIATANNGLYATFHVLHFCRNLGTGCARTAHVVGRCKLSHPSPRGAETGKEIYKSVVTGALGSSPGRVRGGKVTTFLNSPSLRQLQQQPPPPFQRSPETKQRASHCCRSFKEWKIVTLSVFVNDHFASQVVQNVIPFCAFTHVAEVVNRTYRSRNLIVSRVHRAMVGRLREVHEGLLCNAMTSSGREIMSLAQRRRRSEPEPAGRHVVTQLANNKQIQFANCWHRAICVYVGHKWPIAGPQVAYQQLANDMGFTYRRPEAESRKWPACGATMVKWLDCSPPLLGKLGSIPGEVALGFSRVGIVPDDAAGRRVFFSGISRLPHTSIPHPPRFTSIGSQDLDAKSRPDFFTHAHRRY